MSYALEIRDSIHRTIGVSGEEARFLDHPFVQRLRDIRQLGWVYLVYPGATHDRFCHSLGAMHLVGKMWQSVLEREDGAVLISKIGAANIEYIGRVLRLAALLHDVGHPPFSHVAEQFLPKLGETEFPLAWAPTANADRPGRHEDMSVVLIAAMVRDARMGFSASMAQDVASLVHKEVRPSGEWTKNFGDDDLGLHAAVRSFVSGEVDCDRMDYLLRDAHNAGTIYGHYDIDRLIDGQGVALVDGRWARYVDANSVRAFEDFLLARYHMFIQVYQHKTGVGFDNCLREAALRGEIDLRLPGDAAGFAVWQDATVRLRLQAAAIDPLNEWSRRLVGREPLRNLMAAEMARPDDVALLERVRTTLDALGIERFESSSRQYLSRMPLANTGDGRLFARRKLLGRVTFEPLAHYSDLLEKYHAQIDIQQVFIRRADWPKAQSELAKLVL